MNSPRFAPAGLLVEHDGTRVMLDGGEGASPSPPLDAWLVTDGSAELIAEIRRLGARFGLRPAVERFTRGGLELVPRAVEHTSHPTFGYLMAAESRKIVWAPEFWRFPSWAEGADLMFADAASWNRPIRFAGGVGGHAGAPGRGRGPQARRATPRARPHRAPHDPGDRSRRASPLGAFGTDGAVYELRRWG